MQRLSPAIDQCKSNTCLREEKGVRLGGKKQWGWFIENPNYISQVYFLLEVHYNLNQNWTAVLGTTALCHSCLTTKISSVSKPYCPLTAQPSWTQPPPAVTASGQNLTTVHSIHPPIFLLRLGNRCLQAPCLVCHSLPCFCLLFSNTRRQHLMLQ